VKVRRPVAFGEGHKGLLAAALVTLALTGAVHLARPYAATRKTQESASSEPQYLTPVELKLSRDGKTLYVVCEGNDSLLAVTLPEGKVTARVKVGHKPRGVALSPDGKTLYVSNTWSDTVSEIDAASLQIRRTLTTGWGPVGLTTDRAGKFLYVANSIGNNISVFDLASGQEVKRLSAHRYPEQVVLSRDGRRVYVSNVLPHITPYDEPPVSELTALDAQKQTIAERILIPGVIELRHIAEAPAKLGGYLIVAFMRPKNLGPLIQVGQGWVLTHGMAVVKPGAVSITGESSTRVTEVLLDDIDYSFAGSDGTAFTPDGRFALVTAAEANIVSILDTARLARRLQKFPAAELADRLDSAQAFVARRLPTGHNPTSVTVSPDGRRAYIANRLDDTVTVVDVPQLKVAGTIDLGGPKEITQMRLGERMFNDARFCYQGQFACATCHPNRHLDGLAWNLETPRLGRDRVANRTLRGIAETAPYKWNGHNPDLVTQCGPRIAKFLFRSEGFNTHQLEALVTFLKAIPLPPNRHRAPDGQLTDAQERGRQIFYRRFKNDGTPIPVQDRCDTCHPAETHYANKLSARIGSGTKYDTSDLFDTPQLDDVYENAPYLHNGMALTLEEIWTVYNNQDKHGITSDMRKEQLNDLIEFLKTL
jgi:YVTN family beta-propeller protein